MSIVPDFRESEGTLLDIASRQDSFEEEIRTSYFIPLQISFAFALLIMKYSL